MPGNRCGFIVLLFFVSCAFSLFAEDVAVVNSSFEVAISDLPDGWQTSIWDASSAQFRWVKGQGHTGHAYVSVTNKKANDARFKQTLLLSPNSIYRISAWTRARDVGLKEKGANIGFEGEMQSSEDLRGTQATWTLLAVYVQTLTEVKPLTVTLGVGSYSSLNSGTADFDDVEIVPVGSVPADMPVLVWGKGPDTKEQPLGYTHGPVVLIWYFLAAAILIVVAGTIRFFRIQKRGRDEQ